MTEKNTTINTTVKLQNSFVPKSYDLYVSVDLENWKYEGKETVILRPNANIKSNNKEIKLHYSPSMKIHSVTGATIKNRNPEEETLELELEGQPSDNHAINFTFSHEIQEEMRGFYRVHFKTNDEVNHRMAGTHFEPTSARHFYICQDEPAARADFTIHVSIPFNMENFTVLSNGPLKLKEKQGEELIYHFETIPAIPPYLTACFVGELDCVSTTACGIPVKVYTALGKSNRADFTLKTTAFALEYFENFFNCKYPLPKLDLIAVPDFPIGGMENWGCIACAESCLVDPNTSSVSALKSAAGLICHEVSHNWFGNLVAINWWEGLWLKEGFASWCGYAAAHELQKSWKCNEDAAMYVAEALVSDMYEHSHPVEVPIYNPADITQIFDSISYDKGMGLVFMLQAFLGEETWAKSVAHYIQKYQYRDTTTIQLWQALEESSGVLITEAMQSFTTQMGYPMIHVNRPTPDKVILKQEVCQFFSAKEKRNTLWCIPIVLEGAGGVRQRVTLRGSEPQSIQLSEELSKSPFINVNPGCTGFFRCRYDDESFAEMLGVYSSLTVPDRRGLIADTLASIFMGNEDIERLAIFPSLLSEKENDKGVWQEYYNSMENFLSFIEDEKMRGELRFGIMYKIVSYAKELLDREPKTPEERLERAFFINVAINTALKCMSEKEAQEFPIIIWALKEAKSFFEGSKHSVDTLGMSLSAYVRLGSGETSMRTETLWNHFTEINNSEEVNRHILRALCFVQDPEYVENIAKKCIYNDGVRSQYGGIIFASMVSNPSLPEGYVWSLFKKHFKGIDKQWGNGTFRIQTIVENVGSSLSGEVYAKEFHDFFQVNPLPHARLAIYRAVEGIQLRSRMQAKWGVGPKLSYTFFPR